MWNVGANNAEYMCDVCRRHDDHNALAQTSHLSTELQKLQCNIEIVSLHWHVELALLC